MKNENKKIGLITFHRTSNFGSTLQTYGLYKSIVDFGFDCEIIDYRCPAIEERENIKTKTSFLKPKEIIKKILFQPTINKKVKNLKEFTKTKMQLSETYYPNTIKNASDKYYKIFSGSDIVWGRDITKDDYNYFLEFVTSKEKKFAFASSVGTNEIRNDESRLNKLLNDFSSIAVREDQAVEWVKKIANVSADLVCDPTMLLTASEWDKEVETKQKYRNYILVYFDNENGKCLNDAIKYAKKTGEKVVYINSGLSKKGVINVRPTSISEFLSLIKYASLVVTASYHGILFSLYYNVELMFYTRVHSSRVTSLAKKLDITSHCGDKWDANTYQKLDYQNVNLKMAQFRDFSKNILKEMLEK